MITKHKRSEKFLLLLKYIYKDKKKIGCVQEGELLCINKWANK